MADPGFSREAGDDGGANRVTAHILAHPAVLNIGSALRTAAGESSSTEPAGPDDNSAPSAIPSTASGTLYLGYDPFFEQPLALGRAGLAFAQNIRSVFFFFFFFFFFLFVALVVVDDRCDSISE